MTTDALTKAAMEKLFKKLLDNHQQQDGGYPRIQYDASWLSPCLTGSKNENNQMTWKPVSRSFTNPFSDLENALDVEFHPSVKSFYGHFWSDGLWGKAFDEEISLIQVWNEEDLEMLRQNLLGHAFAKKKNRQALTLFIGCTIDDDIVSIRNDDGVVVIEKPGKKQHREIASSVAVFLNSFEPSTRPYSPL